MSTVQVQLAMRTSVLVGMYGSALANVVFMSRYAHVVQLFPYNVRWPIFETIATR